jgi:nucleotide-binding universal stress UspA family protein
MKIEHIYVPTDFSETSVNAMVYASHLARALGKPLTLVHVYQKPYVTTAYNGGLSAAVDTKLHAEMQKEIMASLQELSKHDALKGLAVKARLVTDKAVWALHEDLPQDNTVIVMGTTGMTGFIHGGLMGTNAERLIRYAPQPVFSIPADYKFEPIKRILFPTDFSEEISPYFDDVVELAKLFGAEIEVAVINTASSFASRQKAEAAYQDLKAVCPYDKMHLVVYNEESVEEGIRDLSLKHDIQLIAMVTHGRTGLAHLLRGSITEDISATVKTPLMAIAKRR